MTLITIMIFVFTIVHHDIMIPYEVGLCFGSLLRFISRQNSLICGRIIGIYANITIYSRDDGVLGLTSAAGWFL